MYTKSIKSSKLCFLKRICTIYSETTLLVKQLYAYKKLFVYCIWYHWYNLNDITKYV